MRTARLIVAGYGKIGKAFISTLEGKASRLRDLGYDLKVVAVCEKAGSVVDADGIDLKRLLDGKVRWGKAKTLDVIRDVDADIVLELTPGNVNTGEPGLGHIRAALNGGRHVVTSNKSPLVLDYAGLDGLAGKRGVKLKIEATVGGAIPVINTCLNELKCNGIRNIYGILNGTTNYILSKMAEEGVDFQSALAEAQSLGLAEPDPSYDIEGVDTAAKVVILANAVLEGNVKLRDIRVEGIDSVTAEAVELAKEHGFVVKLVGDVAGRRVGPRLVPVDHPLNVSGSLNAILVETDVAGDITLTGAGAGPRETSSALLGDVLEVLDAVRAS